MRTWPCIILLPALFIGPCTPEADVLSVARGSTSDSLTFHAAQDSAFSSKPVSNLVGIVVSRYPCDSGLSAARERVWVMRAADGVGPSSPPTKITYGVNPPGYIAELGPLPLSPGCYEALLAGADVSAQVNFEVASDGSVTEARSAPGQAHGGT